MGLITKEVFIKIGSNNKKRYKELGYEIENYEKVGGMGQVYDYGIWVKVEDASGCSNVEAKCDGGCNKTVTMELINYKKNIENNNGKYYCTDCFRKIGGPGPNRGRLAKLKKSISFEDWCKTNNNLNWLKRWDYKLNKFSPNEISFKSHKKIYFICENKIKNHRSKPVPLGKIAGGRTVVDCDDCNSLAYNYQKYMYLWSDKNKNSPWDVSQQSSQSRWFKCENSIHPDYFRKVSQTVNLEFRCKECSRERQSSLFQIKVQNYIESIGYKVYHEDACSVRVKNIIPHKTTKTGLLKYDNEIVISENHRIFCEVNGIQHYEITGITYRNAKENKTTPAYELWYQQQKDKFKKEHILSLGYSFIEISYKLDTKDEPWKKIIDKAIAKELRKIKKENKNT